MRRILGLMGLMACLICMADARAQEMPGTEAQISQFVRRIFQDTGGDLWLGTNGDGVARYDGHLLEYFSVDEGFGGVAVRAIVEDQEGTVWFGTSAGVTRYEGETHSIHSRFTNFTEFDGLPHPDVWSMAVDSKGTLWVGTLQGACRYDGEGFIPFALPESEPDHSRGVTSARIVHSIMEDSQGRMWFGTGGGAYVYDGQTLTHISEADGLINNSVNDILEDRSGIFWFATHHQGVCRWDGNSFTPLTARDGVQGTEVWDLYEDQSGHIWFPVEGYGLYRHDGQSIQNFFRQEGLDSPAIQCTYQDREGRLWAGGYLGLYRLEGEFFVHVGKDGPWPQDSEPETR